MFLKDFFPFLDSVSYLSHLTLLFFLLQLIRQVFYPLGLRVVPLLHEALLFSSQIDDPFGRLQVSIEITLYP